MMIIDNKNKLLLLLRIKTFLLFELVDIRRALREIQSEHLFLWVSYKLIEKRAPKTSEIEMSIELSRRTYFGFDKCLLVFIEMNFEETWAI